MISSGKSIYVGMSGGVDSSVAAALLKEKGHRVVGVYMKNWTQDIAGFECSWKEDFQDAKRVATKLNIELKVFDFQKEYKQKVVDYMIAEYQAGRTPNPDIMCNQEVKFKLFLNTALEQGADMIATGHYARTAKSEPSIKSPERSTGEQAQPVALADSSDSIDNSGLFVAKNVEKDQSYFLYRVTEEALSKTLFPIGGFKTKQEVRELAKKYDLPTAEKKDSQGICFVGQVGIKEFLSQYVSTEPGAIIDHNNKEIGQHEGAIFYTIGQRHGLNVGGGLPYYVVGKDMEKNEVYVTNMLDDKQLWQKEVSITDLHWINDKPDLGKKYQARTRYRAPLVDCSIEAVHLQGATLEKNKSPTLQGPTLQSGTSGGVRLVLDDEVRAITPGQSAVIYDGDQVLGGGIVI